MKKIMLVILSFVLFAGGCAAESSTKEAKAVTEETSTLQEQITALTNEFKNYIMTPSMEDYVLVPAEQMNPVITKTESALILEIQSSGKEAYENMQVIVLFYDNEDKMISSTNLFLPLILPNVKQLSSFSEPQTKEGLAIAYDHYEFQFKALQAGTELINYSDKVAVTANKDATDAVLAKITNTSDQMLTSVITYILYYRDGKLVGCEESNTFDLLSKEYEILYFQGPYGINYSRIPFDDYKVYVAAAVTKSIAENL